MDHAKAILAKTRVALKRIGVKSASALKTGHELLIQLAGATLVLVGIAELIGYAPALIIGGLAAILVIERQPSSTAKADAEKLASLHRELKRLHGTGTAEVPVQSVLNAIGG